MGLFSFLKRDKPAPAKAPKAGAKVGSADEVQTLRLRARRRLIGAAVLVAAGVIGFPLIFETQPRPIPVDLPIEIPRKESAPPLVVPPVAQGLPASAPAPEPASAPAAVVAEAPPPVVALPKPKPADKPAEKPADKPVEKILPKPADGARAQALLEGREPAASAPAARFIVQVGAFSENKAAQEMRLKVEKLGLKTYAQAVDTADGRRVRVRVGPFTSREEADRASAKLRAASLPGNVLTL